VPRFTLQRYYDGGCRVARSLYRLNGFLIFGRNFSRLSYEQHDTRRHNNAAK
jgi:hypothetical protein